MHAGAFAKEGQRRSIAKLGTPGTIPGLLRELRRPGSILLGTLSRMERIRRAKKSVEDIWEEENPETLPPPNKDLKWRHVKCLVCDKQFWTKKSGQHQCDFCNHEILRHVTQL